MSEFAPTPVFRWPVRVYWDDTDGSGVVYHGRYASFFDRARTDWLRQAGLHQAELAEQHGTLIVVRRMTFDLNRPARLDDLCEVTVAFEQIRQASATLRQTLVHAATGACLVSAQIQLACLHAQTFRPTAFPPAIRRILDALEPQAA